MLRAFCTLRDFYVDLCTAKAARLDGSGYRDPFGPTTTGVFNFRAIGERIKELAAVHAAALERGDAADEEGDETVADLQPAGAAPHIRSLPSGPAAGGAGAAGAAAGAGGSS
jgi:hypothetical protein